MITRPYTALSLMSLAMLLLGFAALGAPEALRGPLLMTQALDPQISLGLFTLTQPVYLSDAVGLILLALTALEVWVVAITWEVRRQRRAEAARPKTHDR
jgi:hypothetical protein